MLQPPDGADYPIEIRGFVTDPKAVGFQVLTNYESTFVRAYVGNDAWGLYEVLRSFCHDGNNICHPSINYLLSILGIKQRRVLTGWTTKVKGKQYTYPGLIEVLQQADLLIAEMDDAGPIQRYIFHVNLTPGMLTPQQVATLPDLMQTKHKELIQRHLDQLAALERKRRPPKVGPDAPGNSKILQDSLTGEALPPQEIGESRSDKLSPPMTICHDRYDNLSGDGDNLSPKQHPLNNTQRTDPRASGSINNNRDKEQNGNNSSRNIHKYTKEGAGGVETPSEHPAVVVALIEKGMAEKVAVRLGAQYQPERIQEKIDFLAYVLEEDPGRIKNPRGWLRRAIEENYGPPDGYAPPAERATRASRAAAERRRQYLPDEYLPYLANYQTHVGEPTDTDSEQDGAKREGDVQQNPPVAHGAADDPMAVDMTPSGQSGTPPPTTAAPDPRAATPDTLTRAARRALLQRDYGVAVETQSFWEMALHDLRHTTPPDFYELVSEAEILMLDQEAIHLVLWDEAAYRRLQHPGLQKALARDLSALAHRRLHVIVEWWQEAAAARTVARHPSHTMDPPDRE